ncbi:hypothetical protein PPL_04087 [Heterostelium album PN500]|uniref:S1-like domain-containing protein n=1 Tax=Heterostelium pallidum (strain ATCC 26659 / Pp 5 / PN500) TaxID=670386 RepID=D3B5Z9_HETP5|nr:hypothetical protein PPL_04087 [Heterostelium album PN500]EFA83297.1 hypothetical protein PPL_04087 [Heterostelium album PN500]|eukprot:XP_020435414.1 hypothetical protein PPL_04087 [Heterostelium album PN500]
MSHARKHVTITALNSEILPDEGQSIVKIIGLRGGNITDVQYANGSTVLAMIPSKFKGKLWIKKGAYAIIEKEDETTKKIRTSIVHLLTPDNVKYIKKSNEWPIEFTEEPNDRNQINMNQMNDDSDSDGGLDDLGFTNRNHRGVQDSDTDDDEEEEEDDDEDEEEEDTD